MPALGAESGGHLETTLRIGLGDCPSSGCEWLDLGDTAVIGIWTEESYGGVRARAAVDLRFHPQADLEVLEDTQWIEALQPVSIQLHDAWVDLPVGEHTNARIGVQKIAWGVADGLHVSDPVSPWNLENPWELDSRLAVPAASAQWSRGPWAIEGVFVPFHTEALLPQSGFSISIPTVELSDSEAFTDTSIGNIQSRLVTPPSSLAESSGGLHASLNTARAQLALTLYTGRDSLPQAHGELLITGFQTDRERVDFAVPLIYPRLQMAALDARAELFADISAWAEVAVIAPQKTALTVSEVQMQALEQLGTIDSVPVPLPEFITQDGETLTRWLVGLDRPFARVHLSLQWLHGFPTERQNSELSDYLLLYTRTSLSDVLALQVQALSDGEAHLVSGALTYLHRDTAEISLTGGWTQAEGEHSLSFFRELNHLGVQLRMQY